MHDTGNWVDEPLVLPIFSENIERETEIKTKLHFEFIFQFKAQKKNQNVFSHLPSWTIRSSIFENVDHPSLFLALTSACQCPADKAILCRIL